MGESFMMTYFPAQTAGEVGFAGHYPGKIDVFDLAPGQSIMVQRDGFLFAQATVQLDIALVRKPGAGLFGGEGIFLATLTGPGKVVVQSLTLERLRHELAPNVHGGDEHRPMEALTGGVIGGIGSLLGSDD